MDFPDIDPGASLVTSRRDLDARKRSRDVPTPPKTHARSDANHLLQGRRRPKSCKQVFGDPQNICICAPVETDDKKKSRRHSGAT